MTGHVRNAVMGLLKMVGMSSAASAARCMSVDVDFEAAQGSMIHRSSMLVEKPPSWA